MAIRDALRDVPGLKWSYRQSRELLQGLSNRILRPDYPSKVFAGVPNLTALDFLKETGAEVIAEIGVYRGHTSFELAKYLDNRGEFHLFDFEDTVRKLAQRLRQAGYRNIVAHGNSRKAMDSYNWSLMKVLEEHAEPIFDYVFLDGAHTWAHDALAFLLIDRLLKPGGYVDFDDYSWSFASSPSLNPRVFPRTRQMYTREQIDSQQVELVVELLARRDPRYEEVVRDKIFRKVPHQVG